MRRLPDHLGNGALDLVQRDLVDIHHPSECVHNNDRICHVLENTLACDRYDLEELKVEQSPGDDQVTNCTRKWKDIPLWREINTQQGECRKCHGNKKTDRDGGQL